MFHGESLGVAFAACAGRAWSVSDPRLHGVHAYRRAGWRLADLPRGPAAVSAFYLVWNLAAGLAPVAVLGAVGFAFARKGQVASGLLAGYGMGILALALTCSANINNNMVTE